MFKSSILACASLLALASVASAETARPMFAVLKHNTPGAKAPVATPNFQFTYTYNGKSYSDTFIGTSPKAGGSTTVVVHLIPVKFTVGSFVADPSAKDGNGKSVMDYTIASPIFDATTDYTQGKIDLGKTQYEDAFQRFSLWGELKKKKKAGYHVLLSPVLETGLSYTNPSGATTGTEFGNEVVLYNINSFDNSIQSTIAKYPVADLAYFVTTQLYLTSGGCCIGGYHSYTGTQAYSMSTYITSTGTPFSVDVAAMSHELGEWINDPATANNSPCGIYEVGDPIEREQGSHPYGTWTYTVGGKVYHVQDLASPPYFGAPGKDTANGWLSFQNYTALAVCNMGS